MKYSTLLLLLSLFFLMGCENNTVRPPLESKTITIWTASNPLFWDALGKEFDAREENSLIYIKIKKFDTEEILQNTLVNNMAEGTSPDIVITNSNWIIKNTKKLVPLRQDTFTPEKFRKDFYPITHPLIQENQIWGMPTGVQTLGLIYNKEYFLEKIDAQNQLSKGLSWGDVVQISQSLTIPDKSFSRFALSGGALGRSDNIQHGTEILKNMVFQQTRSFYDTDFQTYNFASQEERISNDVIINNGLTAAQLFFGFSTESSPYYSWNQYSTSDNTLLDFDSFVSGKVAFVFGYPSDIQTIQNRIQSNKDDSISSLNVGITLFPQDNKKDPSVLGIVTALAIPKLSKEPDLSWKFLTFATKKENQRSSFLATHIPSPRRDLFFEHKDMEPYGVFVRQIPFAFPELHSLSNTKLQAYFSQYIENVNQKKTGISDGLKDTENKMNQ